MTLTPDVTEPIPSLLSARTVSAEASASGTLFDLVLSGIGFVFAIDSQTPNLRESSQVQKQQIDTSNEAGEQTLDGSWVRSQTSWHLGAGASYYEPGSRDEAVPSRFRFWDSRGVDVWKQGKLSLLRAMDAVTGVASTVSVVGGRWSGQDVWWSMDASFIRRHDDSGDHDLAVPAFVSTDLQIVNAGSVLLAGGPFGVRTINPTTGAQANLLTQALGPACQPYWVKGRIITARDNELHQHSLAGGAIGASSELFVHPDADWVWTGVAETPDAIIAAGHAGGQSTIYSFTLTDDGSGSVPKLGQPYAVAELPPGEEIRSLKSYLGRYVGIGTTSGIRVGALGDRGQVQYGPVLVETAAPVLALAARDSFLYAATGSSVIRVQLAETVDDGLRFPYAYDVEVADGDIRSLCFVGVTDRVVAGCDNVGTFVASDEAYVPSGWLESGDIRYGTTAPKAFRTVDVVASTGVDTSVGVSAVVDGSELTLVTLSGGKAGTDISLSALPVPLSQLRYRLLLSSATNESPVVDAVAVKAVPVPKKQRLIQYPVHVADETRDAKGNAFGRVGYASTLLDALEHLENSQTIVQVQDKTRPEQYEATVEKIEFSRVEPRSRGTSRGNFGGIAKITVRTL